MNNLDNARMAAARAQNAQALAQHPVVSENEWVKQRLVLMKKEKQFVRQGDGLSKEVRSLPWVKVEKDYLFTALNGDMTLKDLFRGHSQLLIKNFMKEPEQRWQCEGCMLESNHIDGLLEYFENHDLSYVAVSRPPIEEIEIVRVRMGWKFCWVSSYKSEFNYDFHVSFLAEEVAAGKTIYNFREKKIGPETFTLSGHSVFLQKCTGRGLSRVWHVRARKRAIYGDLRLFRCASKGPRGVPTRPSRLGQSGCSIRIKREGRALRMRHMGKATSLSFVP